MATDRTARAPLDPRALLTSIRSAVYDWDAATDALAWGPNAAQVFRVPEMGRFGSAKEFALAIEPGSGRPPHDAMAEGDDEGAGVAYGTRYCVRIADRLLAVEDAGRWFAGADGKPAFAHGVVRVTPAASAGAGAPGPEVRNRSAFLAEIAPDVAASAKPGRAVTILVAAIDDLELATGSAIDEVQARIRTVMRRRDRYARFGDRFALALLSCPREQAELAARRLAGAVEARPMTTLAGPRVLGLRVGAATAPDHALDAAGLLRRAEEALEGACLDAGTGVALYDPARAREAARIERRSPSLDLVTALNQRRIDIALQPVVDARSRVPAFRDALVRIGGPDGRAFAAGELTAAAERAGLMPLVDARALERATDYLARHPGQRICMKVSAAALETSGWLAMLAGRLGAHPGVAARVIVEVADRAVARDPEGMRGRLNAMKALGVAVAIGGFGAGHTSFERLRGLPVDLLRIDGAFVQNLARSADDRFLVRALVDLAHHLGIATVAEWVDDEATARMLADWGVDYLEGEACAGVAAADEAPAAARVA